MVVKLAFVSPAQMFDQSMIVITLGFQMLEQMTVNLDASTST